MIRGISTAICRDQVGDMQTFMYQMSMIQTLMYISMSAIAIAGDVRRANLQTFM